MTHEQLKCLMVANMMNTVLPVAYASCKHGAPLTTVIDTETIQDLEGVAEKIIQTINEKGKED